MPPSKLPLLTLMKQARAFGLGVVLATQNPVDLDYKGLGNAGTWFIGRLQTERDKNRVIEGLLGTEAAGGMDRAGLEALMSSLHAARVPDAQRPRRRARAVPDALGALVPARPADARRDRDGWRDDAWPSARAGGPATQRPLHAGGRVTRGLAALRRVGTAGRAGRRRGKIHARRRRARAR